MAKIQSFTDLTVWQKAHNFVLDVYKETNTFPSKEKFGLTNQIRRAAVSITSNIAEGFGRWGTKDKSKFYIYSLGSLYEVQNQLLLARDLEYLETKKFDSLARKSIEVGKMLNALISKTKTRI